MRDFQTNRGTSWWQIAIAIPLLPLLIVLLLLALPFYLLFTVCLHLVIWLCWCSQGRDVLLVISESPLWREHMVQHVLPYVENRAIVLNWSERRRWKLNIAGIAFRHFGGSREFNPLAVVFRPFRLTRTFRFWRAFRDLKDEKPETLATMEREFFDALGIQRNQSSV